MYPFICDENHIYVLNVRSSFLGNAQQASQITQSKSMNTNTANDKQHVSKIITENKNEIDMVVTDNDTPLDSDTPVSLRRRRGVKKVSVDTTSNKVSENEKRNDKGMLSKAQLDSFMAVLSKKPTVGSIDEKNISDSVMDSMESKDNTRRSLTLWLTIWSRRVVHILLSLVLLRLSIPVVMNLMSSHQVRNAIINIS